MEPSDARYPVVDLFAGPGGLSEGFAEVNDTKTGKSCFKVVAAIEKEESAWQTLVLRQFFRLFEQGCAPEAYYSYLAGNISKPELITKYPYQWMEAEGIALKIALGYECKHSVKKQIKQCLNNSRKWVLVGGPPCQAYSLAGRAKMINSLNFCEDKRHLLYKEYLRIIVDHHPPVFVMENVKGLLSARVNNELIIQEIINNLRNPNNAGQKWKDGLKYRLYSFSQPGEIKSNIDLKSFLVKSEEYGVPQARHRIFLLGIREDIKTTPSVLQKKRAPTVNQILDGLPKIRSGVTRQKDSNDLWKSILISTNVTDWFPTNSEKERKLRETVVSVIRTIGNNDLERSSKYYQKPQVMKKWYFDEQLKNLTSHESRSHMESDLQRYLFASSHGLAFNVSPKLADFPRVLLPAHKNIGDGCNGTKFADRFRVQIKSEVSKTVTSHIAKDGHHFIHYDPTQCRSLTVREVARLQTFPDNYHFEGNRTSQYHQIGNAIPPYLAFQIAEIIREILDQMPDD